jgi:polyphosphate kinase 2
MSAFDKKELEVLSTRRAISYLLSNEKPDFRDAVDQIHYEKELVKLQTELIKLQNWIVDKNKRLILVFEGREFAGKGGTIRAFTEHLNPRSVRLVALPKPTKKESGQWYFQRYVVRLPEPGEIIFFDRSWYNRAMVEPANGFCTKKEYNRFMNEVVPFERMLANDGILIIKFYLSINKSVQKNRIEAVRKNPLRRWELTEVDENAVELWDDYTHYKDEMFKRTHTKQVPWTIIDSNDKRAAHLNAIKHVISTVSYKK